MITGPTEGYSRSQRTHDPSRQDWYTLEVLQSETRRSDHQEPTVWCTTTLGEDCISQC